MIMNSNTDAKTEFKARKCYQSGIIELFDRIRAVEGIWKIGKRKQYVSYLRLKWEQ
jgi:hypothetical protein